MKPYHRKLASKLLVLFATGVSLIFLYQNCGNGFRIAEKGTAAEFAQGVTSSLLPESDSEAFLNQKSTKSVFVGDSITLQPLIVGEPGMTFQWVKDGVPVQGATTTKLYISRSSLNDAGIYSLQITKSGRTFLSPFIQVNVLPTAGPLPPIAEISSSSESVTEGQNLTLKVVAMGSPSPTYRWRIEGVRADHILDLKTDTLLLMGLRPISAYPVTFKVFATVQNSVQSKQIVKEIELLEAPPKFSEPLTDKTYLVGDVAHFCVNSESATYEWSKDGLPIENKDRCLILYPARQIDSGVYKVTAINKGGSASTQARLTVGEVPVLVPIQDLTISASTQSPWCVKTSSHEFIQQPDGTFWNSTALPHLKYQWFKDGVKLPNQTKVCLSGSDPEFTGAASGRYLVEVTSGTSTASTSANLVVIPKNQILLSKGLVNQAITWEEWQSRRGDEAFCVKALGVSRYFWSKDGVKLPFEVGNCLRLSNQSRKLTAQSGRYTVTMIQGLESAPTATLESSANFDFSKTIQPIDSALLWMSDDVRTEGMGIRKTFSGATSEQLVGATITWLKDGQVAKYNQGSVEYLIEKAEMSDAGHYEVRIQTARGQNLSVSADLIIVGATAPPYIKGFGSTAANYFPDGSPLRNCVSAIGTGPIQYSWRKNGVVIEGQTTTCIAFPPVYKSESAGNYEVTVSNVFGSNTANFTAP